MAGCTDWHGTSSEPATVHASEQNKEHDVHARLLQNRCCSHCGSGPCPVCSCTCCAARSRSRARPRTACLHPVWSAQPESLPSMHRCWFLCEISAVVCRPTTAGFGPSGRVMFIRERADLTRRRLASGICPRMCDTSPASGLRFSGYVLAGVSPVLSSQHPEAHMSRNTGQRHHGTVQLCVIGSKTHRFRVGWWWSACLRRSCHKQTRHVQALHADMHRVFRMKLAPCRSRFSGMHQRILAC